ncbi:helix-turn-helix transcriptional regulator [Ekhidna sp. MALMAid0563]|uniref:helix-turn-helix domain-containing protein n=1 Tax=Ekhidna sp. MALMAid0563 TaxID=3143937 RepID=UPI0032DF2A6D
MKGPTNDDKYMICDNLKFLREDVLNLTQEGFGQPIGATRNMINAYELKRAVPPMDKLVNLSNVYNIDLNKFIKERMDKSNFLDFRVDKSKKFPSTTISKGKNI